MDKGLATNYKDYQKSACTLTLVSRQIFNKNLKTVQKILKSANSKPIYGRMSMLDLSNTLMYEFHYS